MRIRGVRYPPGSVVDLPDTYLGAAYLKPVTEKTPATQPEEPAVAEAQKPRKKGKKGRADLEA